MLRLNIVSLSSPCPLFPFLLYPILFLHLHLHSSPPKLFLLFDESLADSHTTESHKSSSAKEAERLSRERDTAAIEKEKERGAKKKSKDKKKAEQKTALNWMRFFTS